MQRGEGAHTAHPKQHSRSCRWGLAEHPAPSPGGKDQHWRGTRVRAPKGLTVGWCLGVSSSPHRVGHIRAAAGLPRHSTVLGAEAELPHWAWGPMHELATKVCAKSCFLQSFPFLVLFYFSHPSVCRMTEVTVVSLKGLYYFSYYCSILQFPQYCNW